MPDRDRRIVEFDRLNWLGKAVFVSGNVVRLVGGLLDAVIDRTAGVIGEAEKAFHEALDDTVEDAKVLDEKPAEDDR